MSIKPYTLSSGERFWRVREWLKLPDGTVTLFIKSKIPTQEQGKALVEEAVGGVRGAVLPGSPEGRLAHGRGCGGAVLAHR